jgi:hypothetical protein
MRNLKMLSFEVKDDNLQSNSRLQLDNNLFIGREAPLPHMPYTSTPHHALLHLYT